MIHVHNNQAMTVLRHDSDPKWGSGRGYGGKHTGNGNGEGQADGTFFMGWFQQRAEQEECECIVMESNIDQSEDLQTLVILLQNKTYAPTESR